MLGAAGRRPGALLDRPSVVSPLQDNDGPETASPETSYVDGDDFGRIYSGRLLVRFLRFHAVAVLRLLTLTGCRRSEALQLRWRNVGAEALALEDSGTGPCAMQKAGCLGSDELLAHGVR